MARVALVALLWALADLLFGGMISICMLLFAIFYYAPRTVAALARKDWRLTGLRLGKGVIVFAVGMLSMQLHAWDMRQARGRGETVAVAIERYKADTGRYPARLEELTPKYLPEIPPARRLYIGSKFIFSADRAAGPTLLWIQLPPFGRRAYDFKRRVWYSID